VKVIILLNFCIDPIVTQVTSTMLGPMPKWTFCSGNSAMPPTPETPPTSQPVHSDADFEHPKHPFALVVNVPLITMTPENGSTEIWLGTHTDTGLDVQEGRHGERSSGRIKTTALENQRAIRPPCQPVVPKGAVVIRDLRLWHCGVGNQTEDVRVMLAMSMSTVSSASKLGTLLIMYLVFF
jgi:ectoine hydroxylase-related dioxygenase (phytanoyl-CoA dioxygenase family)